MQTLHQEARFDTKPSEHVVNSTLLRKRVRINLPLLLKMMCLCNAKSRLCKQFYSHRGRSPAASTGHPCKQIYRIQPAMQRSNEPATSQPAMLWVN